MVGRGREDRGPRDGGQATVEVALVLPLVALLVLVLFQVGLLVREQVIVTHAAREAVRAAAVDPDDGVARDAAAAAAPLDAGRLDVALGGGHQRGDRITAAVSYRAATDLPIVGVLLPDVTLQAEATMRVE